MTSLVRTLGPIAFAAALLAAPVAASDITAMTDAEREAFGSEVRAYLLAHPEVLVEVINELESRKADAQAADDVSLIGANSDDIFNDAASWVGGNPDGDITLVEFIDYRCGYCRKANAEVEQLIESDGNIRFVVKEYPILGEASVISSRFAIAVLQVAGPEAYKKAHDELIALRGEPVPETLTRLADDLGLDSKAVLARMDAPEVTAVIEENQALAQRLQINGTPAFVLGDQMLRGYVPLDAMQQIVASVRG